MAEGKDQILWDIRDFFIAEPYNTTTAMKSSLDAPIACSKEMLFKQRTQRRKWVW